MFRGERPEGVGAADVASRAAGLLSPADWDIAGPQEEIDGTKRTYVLTARRPDGTRIEVRTGDSNSAVLYSGQTPALGAVRPIMTVRPPDGLTA